MYCLASPKRSPSSLVCLALGIINFFLCSSVKAYLQSMSSRSSSLFCPKPLFCYFHHRCLNYLPFFIYCLVYFQFYFHFVSNLSTLILCSIFVFLPVVLAVPFLLLLLFIYLSRITFLLIYELDAFLLLWLDCLIVTSFLSFVFYFIFELPHLVFSFLLKRVIFVTFFLCLKLF